MKFLLIFIFTFFSFSIEASGKLQTLYNSLDPASIPQHLAFYDLYSSEPEGQQALQHAWKLLSRTSPQQKFLEKEIALAPSEGVNILISLVNKQPNEATPNLQAQELDIIDNLSQNLLNRRLKGHFVTTEEQVLALTPDQIDLARGLFISQFGQEPDALNKIRSYEAMIDLMALQILTKVNFESSPEAKIRAMNHFIFDEMRFRFPPHSIYAKDIDVYTFLPSVLDSRRGVCLGVSILYLCLAQRLGLDLEMITPPGHIYVRYRSGDKIINIETTARGIDVPTEVYLGVETRSLQQRTMKDVIGMAHFNQASTYWQSDSYEKAVASYEIAQKYLINDMLLKELLGYNYLFTGNKEKGEELLRQVKDHLPDHAITKETIAEDYLDGNVDIEGLKTFFMRVDETRESIIKKRDLLQKTVEKFPRFRNGVQGLAIAWLQLHRTGEALEWLKKFHELDSNDPAAEYYLAILYAQRFDYNKSWEHLHNAEKILMSRQHYPKAIKELRRPLASRFPE